MLSVVLHYVPTAIVLSWLEIEGSGLIISPLLEAASPSALNEMIFTSG
jgi:hypothetical protein